MLLPPTRVASEPRARCRSSSVGLTGDSGCPFLCVFSPARARSATATHADDDWSCVDIHADSPMPVTQQQPKHHAPARSHSRLRDTDDDDAEHA
jgi:hypothetical protein